MDGERGIKHTYSVQHDAWFTEDVRVVIEPHSFARGGMRKAHRMRELDGDTGFVDCVAKFSTISAGHAAREHCFADCRMQMIAEYYAQQFNRKSPPQSKVSFVVAQVLELTDRPARTVCAVEPMLDGEYSKHSDNAGHVFDGNPISAAFSHFTYVESCEQLVIVDIQGVGGSLYTDPQVHSVGGKDFGAGNLGVSGIRRFLQTHRCNNLCKALNLPRIEPPQAPLGHSPGEHGLGEARFHLGDGAMLGAGPGMPIPMQALLGDALALGLLGGLPGGRDLARGRDFGGLDVREVDGVRTIRLPPRGAGRVGGVGRNGRDPPRNDDEIADITRALAMSELDAKRQEERELNQALRQSTAYGINTGLRR